MELTRNKNSPAVNKIQNCINMLCDIIILVETGKKALQFGKAVRCSRDFVL